MRSEHGVWQGSAYTPRSLSNTNSAYRCLLQVYNIKTKCVKSSADDGNVDDHDDDDADEDDYPDNDGL